MNKKKLIAYLGKKKNGSLNIFMYFFSFVYNNFCFDFNPVYHFFLLFINTYTFFLSFICYTNDFCFFSVTIFSYNWFDKCFFNTYLLIYFLQDSLFYVCFFCFRCGSEFSIQNQIKLTFKTGMIFFLNIFFISYFFSLIVK